MKYLPHVALGLLFLAIALHWVGLGDSAEFVGVGAFFALALAVVVRRELR